MPAVTITSPDIAAEGPNLDVQFLIPLQLEEQYKLKKIPHPSIIPVTALIDTGASHSVIQEEIPKKLGLKPVGSVHINTPSSKDHFCYQYFMRMIMPSHQLVYQGVFTAAPLDGQKINCLIGRDMLADSILIYIGYANQFTLTLS